MTFLSLRGHTGLSGMTTALFCAGLIGVILLGGCATGEAPPAFSLRDSAGVTIAESQRPVSVSLSLAEPPEFAIGPREDGPEFISMISAVRLSDGRIAAVGWAMTEMHLFDAGGHWLRTVGRQGSGPGEFEGLGSLFRGPGDTLVTFEPGINRIQRWTPDGEFRSLQVLLSEGGRPRASLRGVFGDGSLLVSSALPEPGAGDEHTLRDRITLFRVPVDGAEWDSLVSFPGSPLLRHPDNPLWNWGSLLFAPVPSTDQEGDRIAMTAGDRFEIVLYDRAGSVVRIVRRADSPRAVTAAEYDAALAAWSEETPSALRLRLVAAMRRTSPYRVRPAIARVLLTTDGGLWAEQGSPLLGERVRATLFDPEGRWLGEVTLPEGARVHEVDADGVLLSVRDEEGFHHLRFHRLERNDQNP